MKKPFFKRNPGFHFLVFSMLLITFSSCNKRPNQIGADIQPNKGLIQLQYTDTIHLTAYSVREDSVRTDHTEANLLGSMKDPVFGTTVAGFYTQVRLSTSTHDFGTNPSLDSLVLQLVYSGYYGDTNTMQTIRVYELLDSISIDSLYYSNQQKPVGTTDFANYSFMPRPKSPFIFDGDTLSAMIRVRLNDVSPELGNKLLAATTDDLASNNAFLDYFYGLYVTADPVSQGGAISYFNLPINLSRMTIYYSNDAEDSLRYEFFITSTEARYNTYTHLDYAGAEETFRDQVVNGNTALGDDKFYLQAMSGLKARILFPGLEEIKQNAGNKKIVVNEAKLLITSTSPDTLLYLAPSQLALVSNNNDGTYSILDDQIEGEAYFGGKLRTGSNNYQFRINRYVQSLLSNDSIAEDPGLLLFIQGSSARANRIIINGINPSVDTLTRLQLQLNYSLVNE